MKNILLAVLVALFAVACTPTPALVVQAPVDVCQGAVNVTQEVATLRDMGAEFRVIDGAKARKFVVDTGGAEVPWLDRVEKVILALGLAPGAVVLGAYDKNGCKIGGAILPEQLVFGKGA
jgi:hypothetical protein